MQIAIRNRPDYATVHLVLDSGEQVVTEPGVMMAMDPDLKLESSLKGGLLAAAKRALVGESLVLTTWTATRDGQRLDLAPGPPGDVVGIPLESGAVVLQKGAFLAATPGISLDVKWAGAKGFLSGEGLLMIRATGVGQLFACSYGAIELVEVDGSYEVDTTHVVAFDEALRWDVVRVGGLKSTLLSQEGLVVRFSGRGRVWFQTRSAPNLASFLHPFRPVQPRRN